MSVKLETSENSGRPVMTVEAPLVVVSDIHLRRADDDRALLLLDLIGRLGKQVEAFVLNGDIFDFCFGGSTYFRAKFAVIGRALTDLSRRGVRVVFVEGNHEFHMDQVGWEGVEIVQTRDFVLPLRAGPRIKFSHGDLLKNEPLYRVFRALVKSPLAKWAARLIPGRWLDGYALAHAGYSRGQDQYRKLDHAEILGHFDLWMGAGGPQHGIIGHFHVPYAEQRRAGTGLMLSVESWDRPNALVYEAGGFARLYLDKPGSPFQRLPASPMLPRHSQAQTRM